MKDISHTHQHHNRKTDTIVDLHSITDGDDVSWREQILYALYRKVIQYKKRVGEKAKIDSLGTLSYTETFSEISKEKLGCDKGKLPSYITVYLRESIEAARLVSELEFKEEASKREKVENYLIGAVGIGFTIPALLQISDTTIHGEPSVLLVGFATWLLLNPFITVIGLYVIIRSHIYKPQYRSRMRSITRVLVSMNQKVAGTVMLSLSALIASIVIYIVFAWEPPESMINIQLDLILDVVAGKIKAYFWK